MGIPKVNAIANDKRNNGNKKIWMCINFQNKSKATTTITWAQIQRKSHCYDRVETKNKIILWKEKTKLYNKNLWCPLRKWFAFIGFLCNLFCSIKKLPRCISNTNKTTINWVLWLKFSALKLNVSEFKCKQNNAHVMHHAQYFLLSLVLLEWHEFQLKQKKCGVRCVMLLIQNSLFCIKLNENKNNEKEEKS